MPGVSLGKNGVGAGMSWYQTGENDFIQPFLLAVQVFHRYQRQLVIHERYVILENNCEPGG